MSTGLAERPRTVAPAPSSPRPRTQSTSVLSADPDLHVLRRTTFSPTAGLLTEIRSRGSAAWLDDQLHPERIDDSAMDAVLTKWPTLSMTLAQLNALPQRRQASTDLVQATLARQLWSRRQLLEVMVDFWSNHFNVVCPHPSSYTTKPIEDRTVIRANAFGRFEDMLLASAKSPPMLAYLNQDASQGSDPNENYGRELMQLHTVTAGAGYTENDVRNSALVLTGRSNDGAGSFLYKPEWHYVGRVTVLGWSSANASATGGLATGDSYLRYLARHEQTAFNLGRKLATRFVSDTPPDSLVEALAGAYLDSGTAIVPVLQTLFAAPEFVAAIGQKTRRPAEDIVATLRVLGAQPPTGPPKPLGNLVSDCGRMGQPPLGCFPPTGYPDVASGWWSVGGTLGLCNLRRSMTRGYPAPLTRPPLSDLLAGPAMATFGEVADRLAQSLTGQVMRADHRSALLDYAGLAPSDPYDQRAVDKWLPDLTELVLDSPYRVLR